MTLTQWKRSCSSHIPTSTIAGLLDDFDKIIASEASKRSLELEFEGKDNFREQNILHKPYIRICKALTGYRPCDPQKIVVPWQSPKELTEPLTSIGFLDFGDLHFEVFRRKGRHIYGETVLIDYVNKNRIHGRHIR